MTRQVLTLSWCRCVFVGEIRRVVALHELGTLHQTCGRRGTPGLDDVLVVAWIGNRSKNRHDRHRDHQLDEREASGRPKARTWISWSACHRLIPLFFAPRYATGVAIISNRGFTNLPFRTA